MFIGVVCLVLLGAPRRGSGFIIAVVSLLVGIVFSHGHDPIFRNLNTEQQFVHRQVPLRIVDVLESFNQDGRTTTYAMCPSCHKGYGPSFPHGSSQPIYPKHCTNFILEQDICGEPLLDGETNLPLKPFVYHHLDDFICSLLAQEDLERYIDAACDDLKDPMDKRATFCARWIRKIIYANIQRSRWKAFY